MALGINTEVRQESVQRAFRAAIEAARDLEPAFRQFDRTVSAFFRQRFATAGRFGGTGPGWEELSEARKEQRRKPLSEGGTPNIGGVDHPLWDSGNLKASFQEVGGNSLRVFGRRHYERGSRVPYAVYHQEGRGVPERQIVPTPIPAALTRRAVQVLERHVAGEFD